MNKPFLGRKILHTLLLYTAVYVLFPHGVMAQFPEYPNNPYTFPVSDRPGEPESWAADQFICADIDNDGLLDFVYRNPGRMAAYGHWGDRLWGVDFVSPVGNSGAKHGAADVDGDGEVEVVALGDGNRIRIFDGESGAAEVTYTVTVGTNQYVSHMAIVNLRGAGDRDVIVQTADTRLEGQGYWYYINRSLIAINLENGNVLWRVLQDDDINKPTAAPAGIYEGYWGQVHGAMMCADVDGDGLDETVGGTLVEQDGQLKALGFPVQWLMVYHNINDFSQDFADHLDAIGIGNIRPDIPGVEWVMPTEDHINNAVPWGNYWNTTLFAYNPATPTSSVIWGAEPSHVSDGREREGQNVAVGNFSGYERGQVFVRSRGAATVGMHPWVFSSTGSVLVHYELGDSLPPNFNTRPDGGNAWGVDLVTTIDWHGTRKEYIAAKARHIAGNILVFDAMNGKALWSTGLGVEYPAVEALFVYVADIAGDNREEAIIYDDADGTIKIYWNEAENTHQPKPDKWADPLYRRVKQNWNYYSAGGYTTAGYPLIYDIQSTKLSRTTMRITWHTDYNANTQVEYGPTSAYGQFTTKDPLLTTVHTADITGLNEEGTYHYRILSENTNGVLGFSADRSFTLAPPVSPVIQQVSLASGNHVRLSWNTAAYDFDYHVYRDTVADFVPDMAGGSNRIGTDVQDQEPGTPGIQWTDNSLAVGALGYPVFYAVTAEIENDEDDPEDYIGVVEYALTTTGGAVFHGLALPFDPLDGSLDNASELRAKITSCNRVAGWNVALQGYNMYVPPNTNNFNLTLTHPYFVEISTNSTFIAMGRLVDPVYQLATAAKTDFNAIMLPLTKRSLKKASQLMADIPGCNSVSSWDAQSRGYRQYIDGLPVSDFNLKTGRPYFINMTRAVTWPEGSPKSILYEASSVPLAGKVPHAVWGRLHGSGTAQGEITGFEARIQERESEILNETSPGCFIEEGYFLVQCSSFPSGWRPGDKLTLRFTGDGETAAGLQVILSDEPADDAGTVFMDESLVPDAYGLSANYPNPFNGMTRIPYQLPAAGRLSLKIYNLRGQLIRELFNGEVRAGFHETVWDGLDSGGLGVGSGIYVVQMKTGDYTAQRKMMLVE